MSSDTRFRSVASLLLPEAGGGIVLETTPGWEVPDRPVEPLVWGRAPEVGGAGLASIPRALARASALRRLRSVAPHVRAHRWPAPGLRRPGAPLRSAALAGAVAEVAPAPYARVIDGCARAAGADAHDSLLRPTSGGSLIVRVLVDGRAHLLKAVGEGGTADPTRAAEILRVLAEDRRVPTVLRTGELRGAAWAVETLLPGRAPRRLDGTVLREVAAFCAGLPRAGGPPMAAVEALERIEDALPEASPALAAAQSRLAPLSRLRGVLGHGDLWAGNLLVEGGRLRGIVDWDSWHGSMEPGADLLHLFASSSGRSLAESWRRRPWRSVAYRRLTEEYWRALGIDATLGLLDAVGIAWWAHRTAARLRTLPALATDPSFRAGAIDPVLAHLSG